LLVPESCGGLGRGMVDMGVALEELGRALHPGPYFSSAVFATLAVAELAAEAERDLLRALAAGEHVAALAVHEGRGGRWARPATTARRGAGETWRVDGTKVYVQDATAARTLLVVAAAPDGLGVFAVDREDADVEPVDALDGTRTWADVTLSEV